MAASRFPSSRPCPSPGAAAVRAWDGGPETARSDEWRAALAPPWLDDGAAACGEIGRRCRRGSAAAGPTLPGAVACAVPSRTPIAVPRTAAQGRAARSSPSRVAEARDRPVRGAATRTPARAVRAPCPRLAQGRGRPSASAWPPARAWAWSDAKTELGRTPAPRSCPQRAFLPGAPLPPHCQKSLRLDLNDGLKASQPDDWTFIPEPGM